MKNKKKPKKILYENRFKKILFNENEKYIKIIIKKLMKQIRIGIIGWGPVSRYCHHKAIKKNPDIELSCDM